MVLNTFTVSAAITPTAVKTYTTHYLNRKSRAQRPTAHISYDQGLSLIRQFLIYASNHTVEEVQAFTSQWVPTPAWVRSEEVTIPNQTIKEAADAIIAQLGPEGIEQVGGKLWWQWRREGSPLKAEWIEMRTHYLSLKTLGDKSKRIMLYVHGGAYFFGSVDEHRYQLQRHARKLKARVFAPKYRLAPQFPFPCGIHDCLSAYLYLLTVQDPSTIILAGDSAGGGMILSLMIVLRDQGLPLPAGAILISPWVDLTHSFPSVGEDNHFDYIPPHGFQQRPSHAWPPPRLEDLKGALNQKEDTSDGLLASARKNNLSIEIDGKVIEIKDQIQMYTTNELISHPLVSPVLQPTLGGLPPLLVLTGGGEVLRDEQIYLAHKAANPSKYPPGEAYLNEHPEARDMLKKFKPTHVQLQVWDDLCHVAPTLSFTRPAKFMYRSIAQFGAWALARAQKTEIDILDDDDVSLISSGSDTEDDDLPKPVDDGRQSRNGKVTANANTTESIGKAGDSLPSFRSYMIRQRVDRHGKVFPLDPPSSLPALQLKADDVGLIKVEPSRKWLDARAQWDKKFAKETRKVQTKRAKEIAEGYQTFGDGENPPPSALAGRRGARMPKMQKLKRSWGMSLWSLWGSSHDEKTLDREEKADKAPDAAIVTEHETIREVTTSEGEKKELKKDQKRKKSRSRSRHRMVSYQGQADGSAQSLAFVPVSPPKKSNDSGDEPEPPTLILPGTNVTLDSPQATRPKADGIAFPFKLGHNIGGGSVNASMITLNSANVGGGTPQAEEEKELLGSEATEATMHTAIERTDRRDKQAVDSEATEDTMYTAVPRKKNEPEIAARPPVERFETASPLVDRPTVERFETAREDL